MVSFVVSVIGGQYIREGASVSILRNAVPVANSSVRKNDLGELGMRRR